MSFRYELRLSGSGGQGLAFMGKVLAEAAALHAGLYATQSQSYGPEARGGMSRSEVILSDEEIDFPKATAVDLLLALTQESWDRYSRDVRPGGLAVVDERVSIPEASDLRVRRLDAFGMAREALGAELVGNMIALGFVTQLSGCVPLDALREAVKSRSPRGMAEMNLAAIDLGAEAASSKVEAAEER